MNVSFDFHIRVISAGERRGFVPAGPYPRAHSVSIGSMAPKGQT